MAVSTTSFLTDTTFTLIVSRQGVPCSLSQEVSFARNGPLSVTASSRRRRLIQRWKWRKDKQEEIMRNTKEWTRVKSTSTRTIISIIIIVFQHQCVWVFLICALNGLVKLGKNKKKMEETSASNFGREAWIYICGSCSKHMISHCGARQAGSPCVWGHSRMNEKFCSSFLQKSAGKLVVFAWCSERSETILYLLNQDEFQSISFFFQLMRVRCTCSYPKLKTGRFCMQVPFAHA